MTGSEMDTLLENLLGDPNENTWEQATHRLPALNTAQRQLVVMLLGYNQKKRPVFDLLQAITVTETINIDVGGYALTNLTNQFLSENGYVRAKVTLDGYDQWCVRYDSSMDGLRNNKYLSGSNEYPVIRIEGGKVYLDVDDGEYPVSTDFTFVHEPQDITTSNICDLDVSLHDYVVKLAEAECHRMNDDFEQYQAIYGEMTEKIKLLATGSYGSVKSGTAGQYDRKVEEV